MLGDFCSIINSVANNSVKTEKYFKVIPLGLHLNLRLVLVWPAFSVNILSLNQVRRAQGDVLFLDVSTGCGEQREDKNMPPVTFAGVLAEALEAAM